MTTLYITAYGQELYDISNSRLAALIFFSASAYYQQPGIPPFAIHFGILNPLSVPYPTFPTIYDAIDYYAASKGAQVLSMVNTAIGSSYYTTVNVEKIDAPVAAAIDMLAAVARTGLYTDLIALPTIPAAQIQSDWSQASTGALDFIKNKPTIPSGQIQSDWTQASSGALDFIKNKPTIPAAQIQSDWTQVSSGALDFIKNKPSIPAAQIQSDWAQASTGALDFIKNKPTIPSVARATSVFSLATSGTGATGVQVSTTKDSTVRVTYSTQVTLTLGGSPVSLVQLKKCVTNSATESDWTSCGRTGTSQPTTLSITVGGVYQQVGQICGDIPAAWFVKALPSGTGTHAEAFIEGEKTIYG